MSATGIHHVSLAVIDLDRTIEFYRNVLGFTLRSRFMNNDPGLGQALFGVAWGQNGENACEELAEMELRGGRVEFVQYINPKSKPSQRDPTVAGSAHLAIQVPNVEQERGRLEAAGVEFLSPTGTVEETDRVIWKWCQFLDPDGIVIELIEELPAERRMVMMAERIKRARVARGLTLQEVANRGDFSGAHLSQIERGQSMPSVGTLLSIASALDVPADYFLREDDSAGVLVAPAPKLPAITGGVGVSQQSFRAVPAGGFGVIPIAGGVEWAQLTVSGPVEFVQARYEVGGMSGEIAYQQRGRQCGFVVEGTLLVELGFSRHLLEAGCSVVFDRAIPHRISNTGDAPATAIWVNIPDSV